FFSAMEQFAKERQSEGHQVQHLTLDDTQSFDDLEQVLQHYASEVGASKFEYQRPDEYRLLEQLAKLKLDGVVTRCV
ncbi:cryptochrome/photolyase family protein, partial [Escherichia coli]|nr:cryptochrome/photolyase family protein [Escherichia coli]